MDKARRYELGDLAARCSIVSACLAILAVSIGSPFYLGNKIDSFRAEMRQEMRQEMGEFRAELKDYHGRLCAIEERNKR